MQGQAAAPPVQQGGAASSSGAEAATPDVEVHEDSTIPDFPNLTPMLVMPFRQFVAQGRIAKSVKSWRDEALAKGWLVAFEEGTGKVAIFISHTYAHALPPPHPLRAER